MTTISVFTGTPEVLSLQDSLFTKTLSLQETPEGYLRVSVG